MKLQNNTILITGGSTGIGYELAKELTEKNNSVIICGRSLEKLKKAKTEIPSIHIFQCDISMQSECVKLHDWISKNHPECNVLINNAAIVHVANFHSDNEILSKIDAEIRTNFIAPVVLSKLFLPTLERNGNPNIIFISTGLVYIPRAVYPMYCATKAALHSFVQTLRIQLHSSSITIKEIFLPAIDTPFHQGKPPKIAITPQKAVHEILKELNKNCTEIKVGGSKILYFLSRIAPDFALKKVNELE
jgi:uncharacterized oxidoreductase